MNVEAALSPFQPDEIFPESCPLADVTVKDTGTEIAVMPELPASFDGWPEPERLEDALPDVAQFDLELMPESFRPLVKDVAERMQVPMDFPAVAAIATLAGVTNRRASIQPKRNDDSWIVVPNLWGGIVAPPGMMKSPSISCITQPARTIEKEWREEYASEEQAYNAAEELRELELSAWKRQVTNAAMGRKERPAKPESTLVKPERRRLITTDGTFESLHQILSRNPAGLFVLRDELTGWLTGLERQGREQERAFYLESWNGDTPFTIDRITRGSVQVPHVCISLFGGFQPGRLRAYLADSLRDGPSNDGLIQRFQLIVWPDIPRGWHYMDRKPDQDALKHTARVYRQIAAKDAANPLRLQFNDPAQALFEQWLTDLERRIREDDLSPAMQAHLAKYRSLMPSLALLFALADGRMDSVPLSEARLACDWCDYLETHARRVYSSQARPEHHAAIALSRRLAKGWKREEGFFTVREAYRNGWNMLDSPDRVRGALLVLAEYGWVREESADLDKRAGRPSEAYRVGGEGVVAKRLSSPYEPGCRSGAWSKMRLNIGQEFVIGGFTPGSNGIDALVVGFYDRGSLIYAARVRAGLIPATRHELYVRLKPLTVKACPFANLPESKSGRWGQGLAVAKMKECIWVRPELVANFEFLEWTDSNHVRHINIGLRSDKRPNLVVRE